MFMGTQFALTFTHQGGPAITPVSLKATNLPLAENSEPFCQRFRAFLVRPSRLQKEF